MDRKGRIKELQIINNRKLLFAKMCINIDEIDISNFLSLENTREIQSKVFAIMDEMDKMKKTIINPLDIEIKSIFEENMDFFIKNANQKIIFFHRQSMNIGAIEININAILNKIDYVISESEMHQRGCRIFLVSSDVKFGFCLWKGEYEIKLYRWE